MRSCLLTVTPTGTCTEDAQRVGRELRISWIRSVFYCPDNLLLLLFLFFNISYYFFMKPQILEVGRLFINVLKNATK